MYLNAFDNYLVPREGLLSLNNLPTVVCCRWLEDKSNNSSIETCRSVVHTNISLVEAQKYTIDLPTLRGSTSLAIVVLCKSSYVYTSGGSSGGDGGGGGGGGDRLPYDHRVAPLAQRECAPCLGKCAPSQFPLRLATKASRTAGSKLVKIALKMQKMPFPRLRNSKFSGENAPQTPLDAALSDSAHPKPES